MVASGEEELGQRAQPQCSAKERLGQRAVKVMSSVFCVVVRA